MRGSRRRRRMVDGHRELHEAGYSGCRRWRRVRPDRRPEGLSLCADTVATALDVFASAALSGTVRVAKVHVPTENWLPAP